MKPDGGPAFPSFEFIAGHGQNQPITMPSGQVEWATYVSGLSLRDYFAAAALQGYLAAGNTGGWGDGGKADFAYRVADAMLAERAK